MNATDFSSILHWVLGHGYFLMFIAMLIEGPIITAAAGFAAALHFFNPLIVFFISLAGDLVADIVYYLIGYYGRTKLIDRFGYHFGITPARLSRIEKLLQQNAGKALLILKLTPILPTPGLVIIGSARMPIKKFTLFSLAITLPKSLFFLLVGYYFGQAYDAISKYFSYGSLMIVAAMVILIVLAQIYKKFSARLAKKVEESSSLNPLSR